MPFGISAGAAALIGGGLSAAGGLATSLIQKGNVSSAQNQAQGDYQQQIARTQPFVNTGTVANTDAANLLGLNGSDAATAAMGNFTSSPGYQFQLQQGLRAVDAGAASQGMLRSGATLKAEDAYGTGLANQDFTNYYNRLAGLSTLGGQVAAGNATTANNAATSAVGAANADNSITGNFFQGLGSTANTLLTNPNLVTPNSMSASMPAALRGTPVSQATGGF